MNTTILLETNKILSLKIEEVECEISKVDLTIINSIEKEQMFIRVDLLDLKKALEKIAL